MKRFFILFSILSLQAFANPMLSEIKASEIKEVNLSNCTVRTMFAQNVPGNRCRFYDEVMVGITQLEPLIIRCARLSVTCNRDLANIEKENKKETELN